MSKTLRLEIVDPVGLYAIPANEMVSLAKKFHSDLYLNYEGRQVNMKSVMGVVSLGIPKKAVITIYIDGPDENEAYRQMLKAFEDKKIGKLA